MLIITRRVGEKIRLGDDVLLEVMEVTGSTVRVGIAAPKSIPVYREEIWAAVTAAPPGGFERRAGHPIGSSPPQPDL